MMLVFLIFLHRLCHNTHFSRLTLAMARKDVGNLKLYGSLKHCNYLFVKPVKALQFFGMEIRSPGIIQNYKSLLYYAKTIRSSEILPELRLTVDLDNEKGRLPRPGKLPDTCYVVIRRVKSIRMAVIRGYLQKQIPFDNTILEAICTSFVA